MKVFATRKPTKTLNSQLSTLNSQLSTLNSQLYTWAAKQPTNGGCMGGLISAVAPHSPAAVAGIRVGDHLLAINGQPLKDLIDYYYASAASQLTLAFARAAGGGEFILQLEKDSEADLGLSFTAEVFDGIRRCRNKCVFCFIDQLQPSPRAGLLIKDDDYRMSFLEGNFISGLNLKEEDFQRIKEMRLSPLYISVHTTKAVLRGKMLGRTKPAPVLPLLKRLIGYGTNIHAQIVLIPGLNDGNELEETVADLARLHPGLASIGLVPLGLTRYRQRPDLRLGTAKEAAALLDWLVVKQKGFRKLYGTRLVFAADEFYIRANRPFPPAVHYEEFAQLENGIGMASRFEKEWRKTEDRSEKTEDRSERTEDRKNLQRGCKNGIPRKTAIVTGIAGAAVLKPLLADSRQLSGGNATLVPVTNRFYGSSVTVSGLLTGTCLLAALPRGEYERYIIPDCMLKHDSTLFLDDMTVEDVEQELKTPFIVAPSNAAGLLGSIVGLRSSPTMLPKVES